MAERTDVKVIKGLYSRIEDHCADIKTKDETITFLKDELIIKMQNSTAIVKNIESLIDQNNDLDDKVTKLTSQVNQLSDGIKDLDNEKDQLNDGIKDLTSEKDQLIEKNKQLTEDLTNEKSSNDFAKTMNERLVLTLITRRSACMTDTIRTFGTAGYFTIDYSYNYEIGHIVYMILHNEVIDKLVYDIKAGKDQSIRKEYDDYIAKLREKYKLK